MKAIWTALGSLLFAGTIGWGGYSMATLLGHDEYREETTYDASAVRSIDVDNGAGGITVTGTDAATASGQIHLVARISDGVRSTENRHEIVDGVLVVRASCPSFGSTWCSASYTLEVPHDLAARLRADNNGIRVAGLTGEVDVQSDNGSITLTGLSGRVVADTDNGAVRGEELGSAEVRASTNNGSVRLSFDVAPTTVDASSDNGGIRIDVPGPDAYSVDTSTDNGSVSVDVTDDPASERSIDARTNNGSITIRYATD